MRRVRRVVGSCAVALIAGMPGMLSALPAGASNHTVAVALFYAPTPLAAVPELNPEEYASADMSARLAAASAGRLAVVPRAQVKAKENALHWHEADALRFARLGELAQAVGADRVVVGWIRELALDHLGGGGTDFEIGGGGGGLIDGLAVVVVQVFDASQGRIVYQTQVEGHGMGGLPTQVAEHTVDDAVRRGATQLIAPLTGGTAGL